MKKLFLLIMLLGLSVTRASAQINIQQLAIDANQIARINIEGNDNDATLRQSGQSNIGIINIAGNGNISSLAQTDSSIPLQIQHTGSVIPVIIRNN